MCDCHKSLQRIASNVANAASDLVVKSTSGVDRKITIDQVPPILCHVNRKTLRNNTENSRKSQKNKKRSKSVLGRKSFCSICCLLDHDPLVPEYLGPLKMARSLFIYANQVTP